MGTQPQEKKVFLREATGLVRPIGSFYAVMLGVCIMNLGATFYFSTTITGLWPGSYLPLTFLFITPFILIHSLTSSYMTTAMPRSGGSYVWASRIVNPAASFATQGVITFYDALFHGGYIQLIVGSVLSLGLLSLGLSTGDTGLQNLSTTFAQPLTQFVIGTIIIVFIALVTIRGMKFSLQVNTVAYIIGFIGAITALLVVFSTPLSAFADKFNSVFASEGGMSGVLTAATNAGFTNPSFSLVMTIAPMISVWWLLSGYEMQQFMGGEIKSAKRTMLIGTIGASLIGIVFTSLFIIGLQNAMGTNFFNAASYLSSAGGWTLPVPFNGWFLSILVSNPAVTIIIVAALALWFFTVVLAGVLWHSRAVMAWSWDRVIPAKFSDVHEKYHTPVWAIVLMAIVPEVGLVLSIYFGAVVLLLNATLGWVLFYALEGIAAMLYPRMKKAEFEASPIGHMKIGRIPWISIFGAVTAFFFLFAGYMSFIAYPFVGGLNMNILAIYIGLLILFGAIYYVSKAYHKRRDAIDLSLVFKEIPPE